MAIGGSDWEMEGDEGVWKGVVRKKRVVRGGLDDAATTAKTLCIERPIRDKFRTVNGTHLSPILSSFLLIPNLSFKCSTSSRRPMLHTRPRCHQALAPAPPPLQTAGLPSWVAGFWRRR
uniref:Uncharacterized protein n=1 Tax=Oryza glumipatula TaxID=40148 RepID=A0A0E0ARX2_9ORYZ